MAELNRSVTLLACQIDVPAMTTAAERDAHTDRVAAAIDAELTAGGPVNRPAGYLWLRWLSLAAVIAGWFGVYGGMIFRRQTMKCLESSETRSGKAAVWAMFEE